MLSKGEIGSLDEAVLKALGSCSQVVPPRELVASLETVSADFDSVDTVRQLRSIIDKSVRAELVSSSSVPSLDLHHEARRTGSKLLARCLAGDRWGALLTQCREALDDTHANGSIPSMPSLKEVAHTTNTMCFDMDDLMSMDGFEAHAFSDYIPPDSSALDLINPIEKLDRLMNAYCAAHPEVFSVSGASGMAEEGQEDGDVIAYSAEDAIACIGAVWDRNTDSIVHHPDWTVMVDMLADAALSHPSSATSLVERYFTAVGSRQRFALVNRLAATMRGDSPTDSMEQNTLIRVLLGCVAELPADWVGLLDAEVEELFFGLMQRVVIPFAAQCEAMDETRAQWVPLWLSRPSLSHSIRTLSTALVEDIQCNLHLPYVATVAGYLIPPLVSYGNTQVLREVETMQLLRNYVTHMVQAPPLFANDTLYAMRISTGCLPVEDRLDLFASVYQHLASSENEAAMCWYIQLLGCILLPSATSSVLTMESDRLDAVARHLEQRADAYTTARDCVRNLWLMLLPRYWRQVPSVVRQCLQTITTGNTSPSSLLSVEHMVAMSTDLEGWFHISDHVCSQSENVKVCGRDLLAALIRVGVPVTEQHPLLLDLGAEALSLLMRWSTNVKLRAVLVKSSREALFETLEPMGRFFAFMTNTNTSNWPLQVPTEVCRGVNSALLPLEFIADEADAYAAAALFQAAWLLLGVLHVGDNTEDVAAPFLDSVIRQVECYWCGESDSDNTNHTKGHKVENPPAGFSESSLLTLLSMAALAVLISPTAEHALWRRQDSHCRLLRLRELCQHRSGVDPVYFMVRYLTSGKGSRRIAPILIDGFEANLRVDTVCAVQSFVEGEEYPRQHSPPSFSSDQGDALLEATFDDWKTASKSVKARLRNHLNMHAQTYSASGSQPAVKELAATLSTRTLAEWSSFLDLPARVRSTAQRLAANAEVSQLLISCGIDVIFLSSVCVHNWLQSVLRHASSSSSSKSTNGPLYQLSVQRFVQYGLAHWDDLVARSLAVHVRNAHSDECCVTGEWHIPLCCDVPLPSPLFAVMLTTPFRLLLE